MAGEPGDQGEAGMGDGDERRYSPSAARNRDPIRAAFLAHMPHSGTILEIASGTGEHAIHLAAAVPGVRWWPGDPDPAARASIRAWIAHSRPTNVLPPHAIDAAADVWPVETDGPFDGMVTINMVHIAPFAAAMGLFAGAGRLLRTGGRMFLYGPFSRHGRHTAPSNAEFDANLKTRDPSWGVRDLEHDLMPLARQANLTLSAEVPMPANNFALVFTRA
jgi:cyclopropane fatty-acyl-phospholipid synthase-like methyltransferase